MRIAQAFFGKVVESIRSVGRDRMIGTRDKLGEQREGGFTEEVIVESLKIEGYGGKQLGRQGCELVRQGVGSLGVVGFLRIIEDGR